MLTQSITLFSVHLFFQKQNDESIVLSSKQQYNLRICLKLACISSFINIDNNMSDSISSSTGDTDESVVANESCGCEVICLKNCKRSVVSTLDIHYITCIACCHLLSKLFKILDRSTFFIFFDHLISFMIFYFANFFWMLFTYTDLMVVKTLDCN